MVTGFFPPQRAHFFSFLQKESEYRVRYYAPDNSILYSPPVQTPANKFPKWQIAGEVINIPQEYLTDYRFNQLQSVIVTSNLPIRQETLPQSTQQNVFNPNNPLSYISTLPILTDFRPDVNQFGLQNSSLIFFPTGEFRWIIVGWSLGSFVLRFLVAIHGPRNS
jgi:hypothetical protein